MKKNIGKSILSILLCGLCSLSFAAGDEKEESSIFDNMKAKIYWKIGSAGVVEDNVSVGNDVSFGGMYAQIYADVSSDAFHVGAKAKMRVKSAECFDDLAVYSAWEKAFLGISLPVFRPIWVYGGHGYVFVIPGSFFTILDDYADGPRYGKDGLGFQFRSGFATFGASFNIPYAASSSSAANLHDKLQIGTGASFNFASFGVPLQLGSSLIYNNAKNTETINKTTDYGHLLRDERDYTASFFVQYKLGALATLSGGYTINGTALTTSSSFKHVENYNTSELSHSHILTFISRWKIKSGSFLNLSVEEEAEGAKSFDGEYYSAYGALRFKQNIAGILNAYPQIMYYSIFNRDDASKDRNSLVIYPRFTLEKGRHYFVAGFQLEHREVAEDSYNWIWSIPFYYKFTL
ncbi:MAG: hypothetical protein IKO57_02150 [Treponema sp.]|nr:hypothetical protein [Treponema sp.]